MAKSLGFTSREFLLFYTTTNQVLSLILLLLNWSTIFMLSSRFKITTFSRSKKCKFCVFNFSVSVPLRTTLNQVHSWKWKSNWGRTVHKTQGVSCIYDFLMGPYQKWWNRFQIHDDWPIIISNKKMTARKTVYLSFPYLMCNIPPVPQTFKKASVDALKRSIAEIKNEIYYLYLVKMAPKKEFSDDKRIFLPIKNWVVHPLYRSICVS